MVLSDAFFGKHAVEYCQILSNAIKYYRMLPIKYYQMLSIKYYRILSNARILCQGAGGQCVQIARKVRRMRSNVEFWLLVFRYLFYQLRNVSKNNILVMIFFSFFEETWYCSGTFFCHLVNISTNNVLLMIFSSKLFRDLALLFPPLSFFL